MEHPQRNTVVLPEIEEVRRELKRLAARRRGNVSRYVKWAAEEGARAEALECAAQHPGPFTQQQVAAMAAAISPLAGMFDSMVLSRPGALDTWEQLAAAFRPQDGAALEPRDSTAR